MSILLPENSPRRTGRQVSVRRVLLGLFLAFIVALVPMESVAQNARPVDAVLLMDMSGSMWKTRPRKSVKKVFAWGIELVGEKDRIALVTLGDKSRVSRELTKVEKDDDLSALLHILTEKSNYTDVAAGLEQAYYMLKTSARPDAERVIILFSDGKIDLIGGVSANERSTLYLRDILIPAMNKQRVRVFAFVPGGLSADYPLLQELTQRTDGEYFHGLSKTPPEFRAMLFPSLAPSPPVPATVKPPPPAPAKPPETKTAKPPVTKPAPTPEVAPQTPLTKVARQTTPQKKVRQPFTKKVQQPVARVELPKKAEPEAQASSSNGTLLTILVVLLLMGGGAFGVFKFVKSRGQRQTLSGILEDVQELRVRLTAEFEEESTRLKDKATQLEKEASREQDNPEGTLSVSMVTPFLDFSDMDEIGNTSQNAGIDDIASEPAFSPDNAQPDLSVAMMETLIGAGDANDDNSSVDPDLQDEQGE